MPNKESTETTEVTEVTEVTEITESPKEITDLVIKQATANLSPEVAERAEALLRAMDPNKPGLEEMDGARWSPPIVKINQAMTTEAPQDAKKGDIFTDTGDVFPAPWDFIPVYIHPSHARFEDGKNMPTCRSEDGKTSIYGDSCAGCVDLPFRDGKPTRCSKGLDAFVFSADFSGIYHVLFSKTSLRAGSKLYRYMSAGTKPWLRSCSLSTEQRQRVGDVGKYYVFSVTATGKKTPEEFYPLIEAVYDQIVRHRKKILASVAQRVQQGQAVIENVPADFGKPTGSETKPGEPDFTDM